MKVFHPKREFRFVGRPWVKLSTPSSLPCAWPRGWNLRPFTSCNMQMATWAMEGRDSVTIRNRSKWFHGLWMQAWYLSLSHIFDIERSAGIPWCRIYSPSASIYYDKWGHPCGLEKSGKLPATGPRPGALPSSAALLAELRAGRQRLRAIFMEAEVELQGTQRFRWSYVWDCKGHDLGWLLHASSEIFVQGDSFGRSGLENHDEFFFLAKLCSSG